MIRNARVFNVETAAADQLPEPSEKTLMKGVQSGWKEGTISVRREINRREWVGRAAVDWRTSQIVAAGFALLTEQRHRMIVIRGDQVDLEELEVDFNKEGRQVLPVETEVELLEMAWKMLADSTVVVGFNVREFDIPTLMWRSMILGVPPSRPFDLRRYSTKHGIIDWQDVLASHNMTKLAGWGLAEYARHPELALDATIWGSGSEVPQAWKERDLGYIVSHLDSGLVAVRALHERCAPFYLRP